MVSLHCRKSTNRSVIKFILLIVCFVSLQTNVNQAVGFVPSSRAQCARHFSWCLNQLPSYSAVDQLSSEIDDIYGDMLSMDKPLDDSELSSEVMSASSIMGPALIKSDDDQSFSNKPSLQPLRSKTRRIRPEWWDAFLEKEIGDIDDDTESEKWVLDIRDTVELKRGVIKTISHVFKNSMMHLSEYFILIYSF